MIGIFDSGVGGLTVVREMLKQLPEYQLIYFGDTARTPYGTKSKETIVKYAVEDTNFLLGKGAKLIIVACNTASALASAELKERFPNIPIFEVVMPAVRKALVVTKKKRVGVIGTYGTIGSGIYEKLIKEANPEIQVFSGACPLFVPLVEEGWLLKPETKRIAKSYLHPLRLKEIDTLILACTHYPLLKSVIQPKIGRRVKLVDSAEEVVGGIKKFLKDNPEIEKTLVRGDDHKFYASDLTPRFINIAEKWLGRAVKVEKAET
jgi:glutamate racemase